MSSNLEQLNERINATKKRKSINDTLGFNNSLQEADSTGKHLPHSSGTSMHMLNNNNNNGNNYKARLNKLPVTNNRQFNPGDTRFMSDENQKYMSEKVNPMSLDYPNNLNNFQAFVDGVNYEDDSDVEDGEQEDKFNKIEELTNKGGKQTKNSSKQGKPGVGNNGKKGKSSEVKLPQSSAGKVVTKGTRNKKTKGRVKIKMEFIENKIRRYTTFSKRKTGIMKKAYELSTLTGTQVMLLVASETGHVYTFATDKLQPMITSEVGKNLIQSCLSYPQDEETSGLNPDGKISIENFDENDLELDDDFESNNFDENESDDQ